MSHTITEAGPLPTTMPPEAKDKAKNKERAKKARTRARGIAKKARTKARDAVRSAREDVRLERKARRKDARGDDVDVDDLTDVTDAADGATPATYSIDQLSARTSVPSRTIRFYQAQHLLPRPQRRGRVAVYTDEHIERLTIIAKLQDRGLRIRGMKQLLSRKDSDRAVKEWLGLSEKLSTPWTEDRARAVSDAEMTALIGDRPDGTLAAILRAELATRPDDAPHTYFVPSPGLLDVALSLLDAGLALDVVSELEPVLREGLRDTAESVVEYFVEHQGLGDTADSETLGSSLTALRTLGANAINIIFAQELERTFAKLLERGDPTQPSSSRRRRSRPRR